MHGYKSKLQTLLKNQAKQLSVTIYIPTHTHSNSQNIHADQTRFKNALQAIRLHSDYDEAELGLSMAKLDSYLEDLEFWKYQKRSLAIFANADTVELLKLPAEVTEVQYLSDHFMLSPLLVVDSIDANYYVLDINFTQPRLFSSENGSIEQVNQDGMPGSLVDELGKDDYKKQLQNKPGGMISVHGHTEDDTVDEEHRLYLKSVAQSVDGYLSGVQAPLLLAGTDNRTGNLRKELTYPNVLPEAYSGSVEKLNAHDVYHVTSSLAREYFIERVEELVKQLDETAPEFIAIGKAEICEVAMNGRVESLYLPIYRRTNDGVQMQREDSIVIELPDDIEEIESMVMTVVNHGGAVLPMEKDIYEVLDRPKALCRY